MDQSFYTHAYMDGTNKWTHPRFMHDGEDYRYANYTYKLWPDLYENKYRQTNLSECPTVRFMIHSNRIKNIRYVGQPNESLANGQTICVNLPMGR